MGAFPPSFDPPAACSSSSAPPLMCVRIRVIDRDGVKINYIASLSPSPDLPSILPSSTLFFPLLRRFPLVGFCLRRESQPGRLSMIIDEEAGIPSKKFPQIAVLLSLHY